MAVGLCLVGVDPWFTAKLQRKLRPPVCPHPNLQPSVPASDQSLDQVCGVVGMCGRVCLYPPVRVPENPPVQLRAGRTALDGPRAVSPAPVCRVVPQVASLEAELQQHTGTTNQIHLDGARLQQQVTALEIQLAQTTKSLENDVELERLRCVHCGFLETSGRVLKRLGNVSKRLETSWNLPETFGNVLETFGNVWKHLRTVWKRLKTSWTRLETFGNFWETQALPRQK